MEKTINEILDEAIETAKETINVLQEANKAFQKQQNKLAEIEKRLEAIGNDYGLKEAE